MMAYAKGDNLEQVSLRHGRVSVPFLVNLGLELRNILLALRNHKTGFTEQRLSIISGVHVYYIHSLEYLLYLESWSEIENFFV